MTDTTPASPPPKPLPPIVDITRTENPIVEIDPATYNNPASTATFNADLLESAATAHEVVTQLSRLITDGILPEGTRLPTLRDLAGQSGLSRSLLGQAWATLRELGLIETRRRGGSYVVGLDAPISDTASYRAGSLSGARTLVGAGGVGQAGRTDGVGRAGSEGDVGRAGGARADLLQRAYGSRARGSRASFDASDGHLSWPASAEPQFDGWSGLDFVTGHPWPALQPDPTTALEHAVHEPHVNNPKPVFITDHLREVASREWPFHPAAWTTVGGSGEGVVLAVEAASPTAGVVAVAQPTTPGTVAALRGIGRRLVPVAQDEHGPVPESLERALAAGATTLLLQTNGSFGVNITPSPERLHELAEVITDTAPETIVIEEDVLGPLSRQQGLSLGRWLPDLVVRLRSYCRGFGVDLRTTVVGGPRQLVERVRHLRSHGAAFTSRILQNALAHQLEDPSAQAQVERIAEVSEARRVALGHALDEREIPWTAPEDPVLLWIPTAHETQALQSLTAYGVVLSPSVHTFAGVEDPDGSGLLRIAVPQIPESIELVDQLANLLASASRQALPPPRF